MIKSLPADAGDTRDRHGFNPWVGKIPWSRKCQPTPVFLPEKFHGQRRLVSYSPWGCRESDTTEREHETERRKIWQSKQVLCKAY